MPVPRDSESSDDNARAVQVTRHTIASVKAQRVRTSASRGSRICFEGFELEVVEIGPYTVRNGEVVTFSARPMGGAAVQPGQILDTPWGICEVVG